MKPVRRQRAYKDVSIQKCHPVRQEKREEFAVRQKRYRLADFPFAKILRSPQIQFAGSSPMFWDAVQSRKTELEQYYPMGKHDDSAYQDILRLDRITLNDCNTSFSTYKDVK